MARKAMSKSVRNAIYQKYNGHCAYCGAKIEQKNMQIDHLQSVRNHGEDNSIENLMPSCRLCNNYKRAMSLEAFREQIGLLIRRLEKVYIYRLAKKYGQISEISKEVKFYFEEIEECIGFGYFG